MLALGGAGSKFQVATENSLLRSLKLGPAIPCVSAKGRGNERRCERRVGRRRCTGEKAIHWAMTDLYNVTVDTQGVAGT